MVSFRNGGHQQHYKTTRALILDPPKKYLILDLAYDVLAAIMKYPNREAFLQ